MSTTERLHALPDKFRDARVALLGIYGAQAVYVDQYAPLSESQGIGMLTIASARWAEAQRLPFIDPGLTVDEDHAFGILTATPERMLGHLRTDIGSVVAGHDLVAAGVTLTSEWATHHQGSPDQNFRLAAFNTAVFKKLLLPWQTFEITAAINQVEGEAIISTVTGMQGDKKAFEVKGLTVVPTDEPEAFSANQLVEAAAQTLGLVALQADVNQESAALLRRIGKAEFLRSVDDSDALVLEATITKKMGPLVTGSVNVWRTVLGTDGQPHEEKVATITDITFMLAPKEQVAQLLAPQEN